MNTDIFFADLEKFKQQGANILIPSTIMDGLSEFHRPVIDTVHLSTKPDDGDIYLAEESRDKKKPELSTYFIHHQGMQKICVCAGIMWHPTECRMMSADTIYMAYKAVGGVRKADGTPVWMQGEYDIDLLVVEQELRESYMRKDCKWENGNKVKRSDKEQAEYVEFCVSRDLLFKRKHRRKLCESGAKDRVIRGLLGLKGKYTLAELRNPFVIVRIVVRPDYNDPAVKQQIVNAAIANMTGVYGGGFPSQMAALPSADSAIMPETLPLDIPEAPAGDESQQQALPPAEESQTSAAAEKTGSDEVPSSAEVDFCNLEEIEQVKLLKRLSGEKHYNLADRPANLKKMIDKYDAGERLAFFRILHAIQ